MMKPRLEALLKPAVRTLSPIAQDNLRCAPAPFAPRKRQNCTRQAKIQIQGQKMLQQGIEPWTSQNHDQHSAPTQCRTWAN